MKNSTKIIGMLLLVAGIIIIGWTLQSSYNIFTGKTTIPEIFKTPPQTQTPPTGQMSTNPADLQKELRNMVGEQLKGILPVDSFSKLLNLISWSILAFILIYGGGQISGLGIKLTKE